MSDARTAVKAPSILLPGTFLVLLYCKLTGSLDASWWVVAAPLWGPFALVAAIVLVLLVAVGLIKLGAAAYDRIT